MRPIMLDECKGGPHEFRGVYRGGLLRTLCSGVPAERIHYGCAVEALRQDDDGGEHTHAPLPCAWKQRHEVLLRMHFLLFVWLFGEALP